MPGFGSQPYGSSPYGIGTPAVATGPTGKIFLDVKTGAQTGSRRIDPATKDYAFDESGRISGMPDTHQLVTLALSTIRTSASQRNLGHRLDTVKVVTGNIENEIRLLVADALSELVANKRISLNDVKVIQIRPATHVVRVFWTDLSTGREYTTDK